LNEKTVTQWIVSSLRDHGAEVQRIEDSLSVGIPDINVCAGGVETWIEVKYKKAFPVRANTPIKMGLRPAQLVWAHRRNKQGGRSWILSRIEDVIFLHKGMEQEIFDGMPAELFKSSSTFGVPVRHARTQLIQELYNE